MSEKYTPATDVEKALRQSARSSYKMAETMKMARLAQSGELGSYLVKKHVSKIQRQMNAKIRKSLGIK